MGSIGRYVFRTTFGAFLVVLISVTTLMWITQALRNIDLVTAQGQNVFVFIGITGLIIPLLMLLIAPIALTIAVAHVLNRLGNDSELIVMNAAGMPPWRIFTPFPAVGIVVSLLVAFISVYLSPKCLRELRRWVTEVRTEAMTTNLQAGKFTVLDIMLTLHVRDRRPNGQLVGIMLDDRRDPKERVSILAETGDLLSNERGIYLVLENGTVQRHEATQRDPAIVRFEQYAFDLSSLSPGTPVVRFSAQERFPWELYNRPPEDTLYRDQPGQFHAELHNRLLMPLYPLAFLVVTFAYLGAPRTTRQSRAMSFISAVAAVAALRGLGFVGTVAGSTKPIALLVPYLALLVAFALGAWGITRGIIIEPPAFISNAISAAIERMSRRTAALSGQAP
ncbi:MAG: lipopolysaccharide export system permease protein [Alphaproteobacteria bacterium]|nr:lipopolysaccharide export system permease protein [Alphaproteobacteria bacterium]